MIFEFWQEHHEEFLDLLHQRDFPPQRIGRYKAMIERLIIRGSDGTWESYDDANNYYKERTDLAEGTRQFYFSVINKLQTYHLNGELPVYRTRKGHFPESDHSKGELDLLPAYERLDTFISCYRDEGYCDTLITDTHRIILRIIVLSRTIEWNSFQEIKDWYRDQGLSEKYLYAVYSALDRFECWWSHGIFPTRSGIQPQLKYVEPSIGVLDLTYLQSHLNLLLSHMKEHGYSKDYIRKTKFIASRIIVLSRTIAWDSYEDVWKWYQSNDHQDGYLRDVRRILGLLANFHIYGLFPNNGEVQNPLCLRPSAYSNLNHEFRLLVDFGCQVEEKRGLKQSTVHKNRSEISLLLYSLQIAGEDSLSKITECGVVSFFYKDGKYLYGYSTASSIAIFLKDAMEYAPDECGRVLSYVPKIRKTRNNIQYLTDAESDAFCTALEDMRNGLSYKCRAIGTLLYYTGIMIEDWLEWLSLERGCSPETCNNRLSSLRTFIKYLASREAKYLYLKSEADNVPLRKTTKKKVNGLTRNAVAAILAEPDQRTKTGVRDLTFLTVLYGTAARIDEVLSMKIGSLRLDFAKPYANVVGKGDKVRTLYLPPRAVAHLKQYICIFHGTNPDTDAYVFYSRNIGPNGKMSQAAIRKMLKKYAVTAHEKCSDVPLDLHAHQFRHAKATHWLEDGVNIVQISFLLGHEQLDTTMRYLDITTEQEITALSTLGEERHKNIRPKWNSEKDLLSAICNLRRLKK